MLGDLFPSRTITLYLARLFIGRILALLLVLVLVLQTLQLLSESGDILAVPGNGEAELWYYVSLNVPQLIARFLPYSVLLATLFTFWPLNQNSEVIAMRAAGLSAHQILAPLLLTAGVVWLASFAWARSLARSLRLIREMRFGWAQVGDQLEERFTLINHGVYPAIWPFWGMAKFGWSEALVGLSLAAFGIIMAAGIVTTQVVYRLLWGA